MERAQDEVLGPAGLWGQAIPAKHGFEARLLFDPVEVDAVTHLRCPPRKATRGDGAPLRTAVSVDEGWRSGCSIEPQKSGSASKNTDGDTAAKAAVCAARADLGVYGHRLSLDRLQSGSVLYAASG